MDSTAVLSRAASGLPSARDIDAFVALISVPVRVGGQTHRDDFLYDVATGGIYAGLGIRFWKTTGDRP